MKVIHSWLKEYVGEKLPEPSKVEELLNAHAFEIDDSEEVEGESVIDVDVLPNRASDCLCHRGIARELATILDTKLVNDPLSELPDLPKTDLIEVKIADAEACPRFTAALIRGIEVKESPEWLQKRMRALGQRSINNIVDATNYVMYAIGQPLHAYDADLFPQVDGKWHFDVRFAAAGEKVSLLAEGGKEEDRVVELTGSELLIVDGSSNTPVGLAGVKGGRYAGVHAGTKNIIIEAAHFHPTITRKTARGLGIVIDASKRFENEPSRELSLYAQRDIISLITDIAGGELVGVHDEYLIKKAIPTVTVRISHVNALLGLSLTLEEVSAIIQRTGAVVEVDIDSPEAALLATGPFERSDLNIEADYIEEVGRIYGLHKIVSVVPESRKITSVNKRQFYSEAIRQSLMKLGFSEIITSSFQKKGDIQLRNALASDKSYLRSSLTKNITAALDSNHVHTDLLGLKDVRVFEIGTVFYKTETGIGEFTELALGVRTKGDGYHPNDDKILREACDSLAGQVEVDLSWKIEKGVATVNLSEAIDKLPVPPAYAPVEEANKVTYKSIVPYPASARDIALWVPDEESSDSVLEKLTSAAGKLCVRQTLFDTFSKDGRTSYAFRLVFQSAEKTLTDADVNEAMDSVYQAAKEAGFEVR
ncbi:phenylalanine--tRNA ligase subunit beta [Candidatus Kaiserbacteria bacterium]|nr:phenylalanine--tRNA ligase subunit beta [Candidatus Kaiserbacteria bacterium]